MRKLLLTLGLVAIAACAGPKTSQPPTSTSVPVPTTTTTSSTPPTSQAPSAQATEVAVTLRDFEIEPDTLMTAGTVTFAVTSEGPTPHNFTIRDANDEVVANSADLRTGEADTVEAELAPGEYEFFCSFAGHESLGMHGTLTVTP
jgi:plastocyanin